MTICKIEQQEAGGPYPRTCPTCKLGRCHFGRDAIGRREHAEALVAEIEALRAEVERLREVADAARDFDLALDRRGADVGGPRLRMSRALAALTAPQPAPSPPAPRADHRTP